MLDTEVGRFLELVSTGDVRLALSMTREFLQYGYSLTGKAYEIYERTGKYILPQHEAIRAIMLGGQSVYREEHSVLCNVFDARLGRTESQLLRIYILNALVQFSSTKTFEGIVGHDLVTMLAKIGFSHLVTLRVLSDLVTQRTLFTRARTEASIESNFLPSRLGGFLVRELVCNFTYLENTMMDTFVAKTDVWLQLCELTEKINEERDTVKRLHLRKERVLHFFDYMGELYETLRTESVNRGLPAEYCGDVLRGARSSLMSGLERAMRSAVRVSGG